VDRFLQLEVDVLGHAGDLDAAAQLQLTPLTAGLRLAQRLLQAGRLGVEVADRLAHLLEQGAGLQVGLTAAAHLGFDLLLALGDPLGQRLDLGLALVERRLRGLRVDLARLLVDLQQIGDGFRGGLLDRRSGVDRHRLLLAPGNDVDESRDEGEDGDCEHDGHPADDGAPGRRTRRAAKPLFTAAAGRSATSCGTGRR
jgi:hypothetical protein